MYFTVTPKQSDNPEAYSLAEVRLKGAGDICTNHGGSTFYKVLEGTVVFTVGNERYMLAEGECVLVPKGIRYQDVSIGGVAMLACTFPPFDQTRVEYHSPIA